MANKGRSNNRLAGPVGTEEVGPPIPRRSSAVGPGLYSRSQLAVVAIDMRAIDIWVHISQGWQVPRRALSLSSRFLIFLLLLLLALYAHSGPLRCNATQHNSIRSASQRSAATQYAGPWIMPALCQPPWRVFDWKTVASTKRTARGGRVCTGSLRGKPLTSPLCPSAIIWPGAERMGQHGE